MYIYCTYHLRKYIVIVLIGTRVWGCIVYQTRPPFTLRKHLKSQSMRIWKRIWYLVMVCKLAVTFIPLCPPKAYQKYESVLNMCGVRDADSICYEAIFIKWVGRSVWCKEFPEKYQGRGLFVPRHHSAPLVAMTTDQQCKQNKWSG